MYGRVEADSIERVEVVRGPASLAYGSNCLGGIVNLMPRKCPYDFAEPGQIQYGGRYKFTMGTGSDEFHGRAEQWFATSDLRLFMGGSARDVGETRAGGGHIETWTGGNDQNFDMNAELKLASNQFLEFAFQDMSRENVKRAQWPDQINSNFRDAGHIQYSFRTDDWLQELTFKTTFNTSKTGAIGSIVRT